MSTNYRSENLPSFNSTWEGVVYFPESNERECPSVPGNIDTSNDGSERSEGTAPFQMSGAPSDWLAPSGVNSAPSGYVSVTAVDSFGGRSHPSFPHNGQDITTTTFGVDSVMHANPAELKDPEALPRAALLYGKILARLGMSSLH